MATAPRQPPQILRLKRRLSDAAVDRIVVSHTSEKRPRVDDPGRRPPVSFSSPNLQSDYVFALRKKLHKPFSHSETPSLKDVARLDSGTQNQDHNPRVGSLVDSSCSSKSNPAENAALTLTWSSESSPGPATAGVFQRTSRVLSRSSSRQSLSRRHNRLSAKTSDPNFLSDKYLAPTEPRRFRIMKQLKRPLPLANDLAPTEPESRYLVEAEQYDNAKVQQSHPLGDTEMSGWIAPPSAEPEMPDGNVFTSAEVPITHVSSSRKLKRPGTRSFKPKLPARSKQSDASLPSRKEKDSHKPEHMPNPQLLSMLDQHISSRVDSSAQLARMSNAPAHAHHENGEIDEEGFVIDTYVMIPRDAMIIDNADPSKLKLTYGMLTITKDEEDLFFLDGEESSDDSNYYSDDEDSNAEDYHANDYPDEPDRSDEDDYNKEGLRLQSSRFRMTSRPNKFYDSSDELCSENESEIDSDSNPDEPIDEDEKQRRRDFKLWQKKYRRQL